MTIVKQRELGYGINSNAKRTRSWGVHICAGLSVITTRSAGFASALGLRRMLLLRVTLPLALSLVAGTEREGGVGWKEGGKKGKEGRDRERRA